MLSTHPQVTTLLGSSGVKHQVKVLGLAPDCIWDYQVELAQAVPWTKTVPIPRNGVDYRGKVVLAPMVRTGELPLRLAALHYGADLVWGKHLNYNTR